MATTTTNFGWDIPQSTDLVKDGATAIAALGQDIDTAFVDFKGGTTGQVLKKTSGTDLDVEWGTASSGLTLINTTSFSGVSSFSLNADTFSNTYDNYLLMITVNANSADCQVRCRTRSAGSDETSAAYNFAYARYLSSGSNVGTGGASNTSFFLGDLETNFNGRAAYRVDFFSPKPATKTRIVFNAIDSDSASVYASGAGGGVLNNDTSYDSATVFVSTGTFGGSYSIFGYAK
jgi:hypothetical protein